ncbi:MAG: RnfABCDGE type electron transport complex subunit D [Calditrichaeota bacterium]|nr:MAG: RnfABCDGE type electron transport complex subunit D [Calditrichota bacterium]
MEKKIELLLSSSPFLKQQEDTPAVMRQVIYSLLPAAAGALWFFGISALLIMLTAMLFALLTEGVYNKLTGRANTLRDGSALLTGLLLAMTLPPGIPLWMVALGTFFAIAIGKLIFGGLGSNIFNPALVGRAFLQASFPVTLTTWVAPGNGLSFMQWRSAAFTLPFVREKVAAVSTATPLSMMKFEGQLTPFKALFLGNSAGSLGETSALLLLLGGIYMAARHYINWRIPTALFATVIVTASALHWLNPETYAPFWFHLFSGGLMLGALFMATDPVTSPVTHRGCWLFGAGIGLLVVVIRTFGGLPEGVMYAILLMNGVSPLLNRIAQPPIYGDPAKFKKNEAHNE